MSVYVTDRFVPVRESRVRVDRTGDGLRIAVPWRRSAWQFVYFLWSLIIVGFGLVMILSDKDSDAPLWFVAVWCALGAWILGMSAWSLFSREAVVLDSQALRHERRLGPVVRTKAYDRTRIEHLRVSPESMSLFDFRAGLRMYGIGGGTIAFDYGARTVRFAQAEEAEARRVVEALVNEGVDR